MFVGRSVQTIKCNKNQDKHDMDEVWNNLTWIKYITKIHKAFIKQFEKKMNNKSKMFQACFENL